VVGQHDPMTDTFTAVHELHGSRWDVEDTMNVFVERFANGYHQDPEYTSTVTHQATPGHGDIRIVRPADIP